MLLRHPTLGLRHEVALSGSGEARKTMIDLATWLVARVLC
jgi:hypothetical protein